VKPVILPPHQLRCFYQGGARIAALRGDGDQSWSPVAGMSPLADGRLLRDAIQADPEGWLGAEHVAAFGADPAVLVKLLDAGERLPVHVHPTRDFARQHLNCPYGKTEAWVVIQVEGDDPHVYLGFRDDVDAAVLRALVDAQDSQGFLDLMHRIPVEVGDTIVVPSGTAHATGAGVFVVELQEPTDFSILLEHAPFDIDGEAKGHLGIGFDLALEAVNRSAISQDEIASWRAHIDLAKAADWPQKTMPPIADPYFRADLLRPEASAAVSAGFGVLVVIDGEGALNAADGESVPIRRGDVLVVPHAAGEVTVTGEVGIVWSRPPEPTQAGLGK
jgi:mannose-6-phosphate isomerase